MKKTGSYLSATALGSFTAVAALLVGLSGANAQAPAPTTPLAGAGSFPGSFIVPGTNTSLHVGGVIQIDTTEDFNNAGTSSGAQQNEDSNNINLTGPTEQGPGVGGVPNSHNNHGAFRINPNSTHPFFETRTPTPYGELKTYWEIDFAGTYSSTGSGPSTSTTTIGTNCCSDTSTPRLKQAYGTLGPWLIGFTNSNYQDLDALADTGDGFVEAGSFMGPGTVKEPQIRYTYLLPTACSIAGSIETAQSAGILSNNPGGQTAGAAGGVLGSAYAATGGNAVSTWNGYNALALQERVPAFTAHVRIDQPWGHAAFSVAVMQEHLDDIPGAGALSGAFTTGGGSPLIPSSTESQWGYQLLQSGHFNTFGADKITWMLGYGQGAAQYNWALAGGGLGTQWEEGLVCSTSNDLNGTNLPGGGFIQCSQPRVWGLNVGYSHWWNSQWRSTVAYGYDHISKPNAAGTWDAVGQTAAAGLNDPVRAEPVGDRQHPVDAGSGRAVRLGVPLDARTRLVGRPWHARGSRLPDALQVLTIAVEAPLEPASREAGGFFFAARSDAPPRRSRRPDLSSDEPEVAHLAQRHGGIDQLDDEGVVAAFAGAALAAAAVVAPRAQRFDPHISRLAGAERHGLELVRIDSLTLDRNGVDAGRHVAIEHGAGLGHRDRRAVQPHGGLGHGLVRLEPAVEVKPRRALRHGWHARRHAGEGRARRRAADQSEKNQCKRRRRCRFHHGSSFQSPCSSPGTIRG